MPQKRIIPGAVESRGACSHWNRRSLHDISRYELFDIMLLQRSLEVVAVAGGLSATHNTTPLRQRLTL